MTNGETSVKAGSFWRLCCWAGAVLGMLVSFVNEWTVPVIEMDLHIRRGHLIIESLMVIALFLIGSLMGGGWWHAVRSKAGAIILPWSCAALMGWLGREVFWAGMALWLLPALVAGVMSWRTRRVEIVSYLKQRRRWNVWFMVLWIAVCTGCDAVMLRDAPAGALAAVDCMLARFLNHMFIAAVVWFLMAWHDRWVPKAVRWMAWLVVILLPLIVLINALLRVWWAKGLIELFGELEVGGRFEIERALVAGGVVVTPGIVMAAVAVVLVMVGVFWACRSLSKVHVSPLRLTVIAAVAWTALQIDQLAGVALKSRAWRWWEMKSYHVRMTPVMAKRGMANYRIEFANPQPQVRAQTLAKKPDVFFFVVETLRADALRPEVAPFMCRWRDECQPLAETWAASNATHLSWFSMLSGRLPVFLEDGRQAAKLALLPAVLKASGYRVEARMVADYEYMDMLATNYGKPHEMHVLENLDEQSREHLFKTPEREVRMLMRLQQSVLSRADGGFYITAFDAPHYPYKWAAQFTPPIADFDANPMVPLQPSTDEVRRIVNRYLNSVAWVDGQMAEFVAWLKAQGRYDEAIIIVTGDHGEEFKEHGSWFHCSALNEPQTRVPILIKWPRSMGRGPAVPQASHLDIVPSVFDALGCERALWEDLPGQSLLHPEPRTIVMTTKYAGKNGEAMLLRRGEQVAAFGWERFWESVVPQRTWQERGPENVLEAFPDLRGRVLARMEEE